MNHNRDRYQYLDVLSGTVVPVGIKKGSKTSSSSSSKSRNHHHHHHHHHHTTRRIASSGNGKTLNTPAKKRAISLLLRLKEIDPTSSMASPKLQFEAAHGPIIGEATETEVVVWYRDEQGLSQPPVFAYWSKADKSDLKQEVIEVDALIDYTSKTALTGLQPATTYHYTIGDKSGQFRTTGSSKCSFVFGSCIGGQGFGRYTPDHADGEGFPIFHAMHALKPDFIQIQGDFVYADNAIQAVSTGMFDKGKTYLTPGGAEELPVATDMESFRARYKYNLEDKALGHFLRNTIVYNTWDDHGRNDSFVCIFACFDFLSVCVCMFPFYVYLC